MVCVFVLLLCTVVVQTGAIYAANDSTVTISGATTFTNNSATLNGGATYAEFHSIFTISGATTFTNNSATQGGAIYMLLSMLSVEGGVYFTDNAAITSGGAIMISDPMKFSVNSSTFASNVAEFGGAVALMDGGVEGTSFEGCTFEGNNATDGGALYLYSNQFVEIIHNSIFRGNHAETSGGAIFHTGFVTVTETLFVTNKAGEDGLAVFSVGGFNEPSNVSFESNTRSCPIGDYGYDVKEDSSSCRFELTCARCSTGCDTIPDGVDMAETTVPICEELMAGAKASSSDTLVATLDLNEGYYRTSNESREVLECYSDNACVGGLDSDNYCADGYEGPYCAVCSEGYAPGIAYSCHKCSGASKRSAVGLVVTVLLVMLLVVIVIVSDFVRVVGHDEEGGRNAEQASQASWNKASSSCHAILVKAFPLTAIKTIVVVWQIVTQFGGIAGNVYPEAYQHFLSHFSSINLDIGFMLSYSCLITTDFYDRLLIATIGPVLVLVALTVTFTIAKKRNKSSEVAIRTVRHKHISAALFVMFFIYSSVSFTIFQTFVCDTLDDQVSYLRADYSLTCGTNTHRAFAAYAIAMAFVYPVGIPAVFSWWLGRNRQDLRKPDRNGVAHLQSFSSLWAAYKPSRYYYEVVECGRRIMLTGMAVFIIPGTSAQIAIVLLLAMMFLFISESLSPFERGVDMGLYRWGNGIVLASMYSALLLKINVSEEESATFSAFVIVLIAANVFMVVTVVVESYLLVKKWRTSATTVREAIHPFPPTRSSGWLEDSEEEETEGALGKRDGGSFSTSSANDQKVEV